MRPHLVLVAVVAYGRSFVGRGAHTVNVVPPAAGFATVDVACWGATLVSRRVVDALKTIRERHRFIRGLVSWVGFPQTALEYDRDSRFSGESKYPVSKMLRFAIDGITSFSDVPLRFASYFGFGVSGIAFVVALVEIGVRIFTGYNVPGYTSTIFAILFLGGVQLIGIGILGEYVGRIYEEIKARPLYLIAQIARAEPAPVAELTNAER